MIKHSYTYYIYAKSRGNTIQYSFVDYPADNKRMAMNAHKFDKLLYFLHYF